MRKLAGVLLLIFIVQSIFTGQSRATTPSIPSPNLQPSPPAPQSALVVRIDFTDAASLANLTGALDIWEVDRTNSFVVAMITQEQWRWLNLLNYTVTLDEAKTAELNRPLVRSAGQTSGIPGYACYRTVEETYTTLATLAADHPNLAEWNDIGDSYDKVSPGGPSGYDLYSLVLTNRASTVDKGKFVLLAAVHARELTTAELATRYAETLVSGYGSDPDLTWLLDYNEVHIIAQGNPDGRKWAEQGYSWRKNTNNPNACTMLPYSYGVDLNRNGSFLWNGCPPDRPCSSADPCSILYRGTSPASEPETKAVQDYLQSVFADQRGEALTDPAPLDTNGVFISLHSYGNLNIYTWDWTGQDAPNMQGLRRLGRKLGYFNRYGVCNTSNCLYAVDGSHTDYAYGTFGVAAYTIEMGTSFFQSCSYFEASILQQNLEALIYAAKAARRPYQVAAGPDTLDVVLSSSSAPAGTAVTLQATASDTRYFSNGYGTEPSQSIAAVRYTVDLPSWAGGIPLMLSPVDGSFNTAVEVAITTIDTSLWSVGRHTIFVESQDTDGNWGIPSATFLQINAAHGLSFAQQTPTRFVAPGQQITHTLTVTNTGNLVDQFGLAVEQSEWPTTAITMTPSIEAGASIQIPMTVSVPTTATIGAVDVAIVRIHSIGDPAYVHVATLSLIVEPGATIAANPPFDLPLYLPSVTQ